MRSFVRTALAIVLLAMIPGAVSAQAEVGIRGGVNFATLDSNDPGDDVSSRTALNVGAFVTIPVSSVFGIEIGVGFSEKGAENDEVGLSATDIGYLQIPVLAKISIPTPGSVGVYFRGGPTIGIRTNCEVSVVEAGASETIDCDTTSGPSGSEVKSVDIGVLVGAGLDFSVAPKTSLLIELQYDLGLSNIVDSGFDGVELKNRAFSILAGLSFKLGL